MPAVNGMPMHANSDIIKTLFRETWNFTGFVHSDWCGRPLKEEEEEKAGGGGLTLK